MRVGGSSSRPKVDPKRPQEMKNKDFEEDRTRRSDKKDNKDDKEREHKLQSHDLLSLPIDYELPKSPREAPRTKGPRTGVTPKPM